MSEREVHRLAQDMRSGNAQDAVNVIRYELQTQPQQALQELRAANNMAGPNARIHLGHKPDGDMALVDNSGRAIAHLGHLQQNYASNFNNYDRYNNPNNYDRYNDPNNYDRYNNPNNYDRYNRTNYDSRYQDYNRYNNFNGANGYPQDMSYLNGRVQDGYYNNNYNNYGGQIGRLANDLARGDTRDAQYTAQSIMRSSEDPNRAINEANRLADQQACRMGYRSAMEHIAQTRYGDLAVVDQYGRQVARIENCNNGYNNGYDRYNYPNNSSYYANNGSYYDGRYNNYNNYDRYNSSYYNNNYNSSYYNGGYDCPPQRYYGNSYSHLNGGQAAAAIGIGVIGGLILSNIGRHNNYNNYHRGRW